MIKTNDRTNCITNFIKSELKNLDLEFKSKIDGSELAEYSFENMIDKLK